MWFADFRHPRERFEPILKRFECPKVFPEYTTWDIKGERWYNRIVQGLIEVGVPRLTFELQEEEPNLRELVHRFNYGRLQEIPGNYLSEELFSPVEGPNDDHPLGDTGTVFSADNDVSTLTDREKSNLLIASWTSLSPRQRAFFTPGPAYKFKDSVLRVMDALWCRAHLLSFVLPKVKEEASSHDFEDSSSYFDCVFTWAEFEETCMMFESRQRLMITICKLSPIMGKLSRYSRNIRAVSQSQLKSFTSEVEDFNTWKSQHLLQENFETIFVNACFLRLLYEKTPAAFRTAKAKQLYAESDLQSFISEEKSNEMFFEGKRMTELLITKCVVGEPQSTAFTNSNTGHPTGAQCGVKHGREEQPMGANKRKKNDFNDPAFRAKTLSKLAKFMVRNDIKSLGDVRGFYKRLLQNCSEEEIEKYLTPNI